MFPETHRILYATDLSANSAYAFRYAVNTAVKHNAGIVILHVFDMAAANRGLIELYLDKEQLSDILGERKASTLERIEKRLELFRDRELKDNPQSADRIISIEVVEGFPADEILKKAAELNCDAIVMGTHGKGIIRHAFLGSTAKRVLRRTRKPVFIIPLPKGETDLTVHDF